MASLFWDSFFLFSFFSFSFFPFDSIFDFGFRVNIPYNLSGILLPPETPFKALPHPPFVKSLDLAFGVNFCLFRGLGGVIGLFHSEPALNLRRSHSHPRADPHSPDALISTNSLGLVSFFCLLASGRVSERAYE